MHLNIFFYILGLHNLQVMPCRFLHANGDKKMLSSHPFDEHGDHNTIHKQLILTMGENILS
jgi:hypothetical protein